MGEREGGPGLTSLPANIFDQNTALTYDALPSFWVGYDQRVTCLVCFAGTCIFTTTPD